MTVTFAAVRKQLLAMPDVSERPCYGTPGFYRKKKKLFVRQLPAATAIVVKMSFEQRDIVTVQMPDVFEVTPHYQGYTWCIVQLRAVSSKLLRDVLDEAYRLAGSEHNPGDPGCDRPRG